MKYSIKRGEERISLGGNIKSEIGRQTEKRGEREREELREKEMLAETVPDAHCVNMQGVQRER